MWQKKASEIYRRTHIVLKVACGCNRTVATRMLQYRSYFLQLCSLHVYSRPWDDRSSRCTFLFCFEKIMFWGGVTVYAVHYIRVHRVHRVYRVHGLYRGKSLRKIRCASALASVLVRFCPKQIPHNTQDQPWGEFWEPIFYGRGGTPLFTTAFSRYSGEKRSAPFSKMDIKQYFVGAEIWKKKCHRGAYIEAKRAWKLQTANTYGSGHSAE